MWVSRVPCCGCAVVLLVSTSPCCRASCAIFVALLGRGCGREREKVRPVALWSSCKREKVRPAHEKWPRMGVLWRAGRTSSRKCCWRGCAGRTSSRKCGWRGCAGGTSSRKCGWRGCAGRVCGPAVVGSRASFDAARSRQLGPSTGTLNPSMRSYTHLVVAGRGCPTGLSNPPRNAKR